MKAPTFRSKYALTRSERQRMQELLTARVHERMQQMFVDCMNELNIGTCTIDAEDGGLVWNGHHAGAGQTEAQADADWAFQCAVIEYTNMMFGMNIDICQAAGYPDA